MPDAPNPPDRSFPKWIFVPIVLGVIVLMVLPCAGLIVGIVLPGLADSREMADIRESQRRMRGIYQAMAIYAQNHDGASPPADAWQEVLVSTGYAPPDLLVSPVSDGDDEGYVWLPGDLWRNAGESPQLVMYEDPDHHPQGVAVLYADGRSDTISREELAALLAEQAGP
ncbi:MAG: hypothetical protein RIB60_01185 [Phycisphaerales bacterium]